MPTRKVTLISLALFGVALFTSTAFSQGTPGKIIQPEHPTYLRPGIDYGGPVLTKPNVPRGTEPQSDVPPGTIIEIPQSQIPVQRGLTVTPDKRIEVPAPSHSFEIAPDGSVTQTSQAGVFRQFYAWISSGFKLSEAHALTNSGFYGGVQATGIFPADAAGGVGPNNVVSTLNGS